MKPEADQQLKRILAEASRLVGQGALRDAELLYHRAASEYPQHGEAVHALGIHQLYQGQMDAASQQVARAVLLDPQNAIYQRDLAEISRRLGRLDQALLCSLAATRLAPRDVDGFYNLGLIYADQGDPKNAARAYRRALKLLPTHGLSWNNLGSALERQGDLKGALEAYQRATKLNPQHAEASNNLGALLLAEGRLDEAREHFVMAVAARPGLAEAHFNLSTLKTYTRDDKHLADLLAIASQRATLAPDVQVQYAFALGKALDDVGNYDDAYLAYSEGNRIQAQLKPYDDAGAELTCKRVIETFDQAFFSEREQWQQSPDRRTPIFIIGMPRAGTSLLEQILATHASVFGAGELVDFSACVDQFTSEPGGFPDDIKHLSRDELQALGRRYLDRVWTKSPNSIFITDKMPSNFYYLGLIHLALPGAKIIHAMRDPMDSCVSCFTRHFTDPAMGFTYDLDRLGRYFSRYARLMQHWRQVLPHDAFLDLSYESLVCNIEAEARRVMDFIGLPWDPACLEFHRNSRMVATASIAQVRKPLYTGSVGRWKHFARHLAPLWRHIERYRSNDDLTPELLAALTAHGPRAVQFLRTPDSWHNEGYERYRQGLLHQALECYDRALALRPTFDTALNSKGFVLQELGRLEEAIVCLEQCVQIAPSNAIGRLNLAMAQLKIGRWQEGWENYEARWTGSAESMQGTLNRAVSPLPQWTGASDTKELRLLVITEQGFGDIFQFGRYLTLAAQRFKRVGFACSAPTVRLMEQSMGDQLAMFTRMPPNLGDWDLQCPLMSLPRAFATRLESVPPANEAYLKVPLPAAAFWQDRIERITARPLRVGIAWAGRKTHQQDARRSIAFEMLTPLLGDQRVAWFSLQKWAPDDLRPAIPAGVEWHDWTDEFTDFADSAALVVNLDLVISVDSAMVHLAGGLFKPTWMLNRFDGEWRWLQHASTSPWYPLLRIFNQPTAGDWQAVIEQVRVALSQQPVRAFAVPRTTAQPALSTPEPVLASINVSEAINSAARLHSAGQLGEAGNLLRRVLQVDAGNAHALHMLGLIAHQLGQASQARDLIRQAIGQDGSVALFYCNLTEILRQQGLSQEAIGAGRKAVQLDPGMVAAYANLGVALYDAGLLPEAEACHKKALELEPACLQALNNLGSIARTRGDLAEAANWYRRAVAISPDYLEALSNLGAALFEDERPEEAIPHLEHALSLQPDYAQALCNLGLAHLAAERAGEAEGFLRRSLQLEADNAEALTGLAMVEYMHERREETEQLLRRALQLKPDSKEANVHLGAVLTQLGNADEAEQCFMRVLAGEPDNIEALVGIGALRLEAGAFAAARKLLRQALALDPLDVSVCFHLAQGEKIMADDPVVASLAAIDVIEKMSVTKRVSFHYTYGKVLDDLGQYEPSFEHYMKGASLKRSQLQYDSASDSFRALRIAEVVNQQFLARNAGGGHDTRAPIFILGMPRSGTTLTEQIIASHSAVYGAGELDALMRVVQRVHAPGPNPPFYPENLLGVDSSTMTAWGHSYLEGVPEPAHLKTRFTDKMPANYYALGLVTLMLPNAKIIHVKRDPIDTCVSCYTRLFGWAQGATYDLAELGRHYVAYAKLMEHWRQVLPGRFLEVQYEDIVSDMEGQARRLIAHCELDWEDACLSFHTTKRPIRTASVLQVRQPIYGGSVQRWRRVARFLDPLIEALGDYAEQK